MSEQAVARLSAAVELMKSVHTEGRLADHVNILWRDVFELVHVFYQRAGVVCQKACDYSRVVSLVASARDLAILMRSLQGCCKQETFVRRRHMSSGLETSM